MTSLPARLPALTQVELEPGNQIARLTKESPRPRAPAILLRIGLGGFTDGIVLHQILQWHHMLTSEGSYPKTTVAGLETNTLWDGLFHAATWIAVAVGIYILWRRTSDEQVEFGRFRCRVLAAGVECTIVRSGKGS